MGNYSELLKNQLNVSLDYIAFTVTAPMSLIEVIAFLGFSSDDFIDMKKGANGYRKQKKCSLNGLSILYDGNEDMGIHVNVTGKAVLSLLDAFRNKHTVKNPFNNFEEVSPLQESVVALFCQEVLEIGQFTRLDIAIDDFGANYYTPDEVYACYEDNRVVSKWKNVRQDKSNTSPQVCSGNTLYFGSRESVLMLRIYDKKLEQNKGKTFDDEDFISFDWVRWELEAKDERANEIAKQLINEIPLGQLAVGILYYYFRIIQHDDCNKSRCSNDEKWDRFIGHIEKLRLHNAKVEKTVCDKAEWIEKQVSPTLALLYILGEFDASLLNDIAWRNKHRISKRDRELIKAERPDIYDMYFADVERADYDN